MIMRLSAKGKTVGINKSPLCFENSKKENKNKVVTCFTIFKAFKLSILKEMNITAEVKT